MSKHPLVYILLLNYNNYADTAGCLRSLQTLAYDNFKILVIDNASRDQEADRLGEEFPNVDILKNSQNFGFAGGNNRGIQWALDQGAEYICLLNNDTVVDPHFLSELVRAAEAGSPGMFGPKIFYHDEPDKIWFAGGYIDWLTGVVDHFGKGQQDRGQFDASREVGYLTGCCLLVHREVIQKNGLLDENYFLYFEDADWSIRAAQAGYRICFVPQAKIWHKVSATLGGMSPLAYYYITRNRFYFFKKHLEPHRWQILLPFLFLLVCKSLAGVILKRKAKKESWQKIMAGVRDYFGDRMGAFPCE